MKNFFSLVLVTLLSTYTIAQNTFTSNNATPGTDFNTVGNWTGTGTPSFVNGLDKFIIADGHSYATTAVLTIDALTIGQGGSGILTLNHAVDLTGNMLIDAGASLTAGVHQINIAGNWTENGSGAMTSSGTTIFDATLVQTISAAATFNNLTFNGGGVVSTGGNVTVNGNWLITNNTNFSTGNQHRLGGNLTVDNGSIYNATDGGITFIGATDQTLTIGTNAVFDEVIFQPSAAVTYTIIGDYVANDITYVYPDATLMGAGNQTIQEFRLDGTCNFSGSITFTGGRAYDHNDHVFTLGTADIIIAGNYFFSTATNGDAITILGNLTIESGYLVLEEGSLTGDLDFQINAGTILYIRGVDNFPTNFNTVVFQDNTARTIYDLRANQTIRGDITYGRLSVGATSGTDTGGRTKTADGPLDINGFLDLNDAITLALGSSDHTLAGDLLNNTNSSILQPGGTFTLDGLDGNQTIQSSGTGSYNFQTLLITNTAPTAVRTINIDDNNLQAFHFSITNAGGSASNYLILDIDDNLMVGFGDFSIGANVELRTSGASQFNSMMAFYTEDIDPQSTILFDGGVQSIPGVTYGNVELRGNGNKNATGNFTVAGNFSRVANTPVFVDGGFSHTVAGNWVMGTAFTNNMTGSMTFDGINQTISASDFNNLIYSGSGIKSILGAHFVSGDLTINNDATVNAGIFSIDMTGGHWVNGGDGVFNQTTGSVFFSSQANGQNITSNPDNIFGNLHIENDPSRTVTALTDIIVGRDFDLIRNEGDFNLQGFTLFVGRHFNNRTGTSFSFTLPSATIHFNGDVAQNVRNYISGTYPNMTFSGLGEKRFYDNGLDINGNVTITNTTLDGAWLSHTVEGNWINSGSFQHNRAITFDGTDQTIGASTFHDVFFGGSGTKTLAGNINLNGRLEIMDGATLDVSPNNFRITVEESWTNTGTFGHFIPRNGTVEFSGGFSQLFTGTTTGPIAGKQFWDVLINTNTSRSELDGDLIVENNLTINAGAELETDGRDLFIAGSFINNGDFDFNSNASRITFNGTSGTHIIDTGGSGFRYMTVDALGATYELQSDLLYFLAPNNQSILTIINGTLDLNGNEMTLSPARFFNIDIVGGVLEVDAGASLKLNRDSRIRNYGGTFRIVGTAANPAVLNSVDPDVGDYFGYDQTGGIIEAQFYSISNTTGNGFNITGGTIDGNDNFSNGVFSNGGGNAYLTLDIPFNRTLPNVIFNPGPTFNVAAPNNHAGVLAVILEDALGGLAGEANDSDAFDQITWGFSGTGIFWDGGGDAVSWNDGNNWNTDVVPILTDVVFLDHSTVVGAYAVAISGLDAVGLKLILDAGGANDISLTVNNGETLDIEELLTIIDGSLIQENTSTIRLAGAFSNSGTYTANSNTFILDGVSGIHTFNTNTNPFYNLTVNASGAQYNLDNDMVLSNDFSITNGIFNVVGNNRITLLGNWNTSGGTFSPGTGQVWLTGAAGTQTIFGGLFNDLQVFSGAEKQLTSNMTILNDFILDASFSSVFDGQHFIVKVGGDWVNNIGAARFTQTGTGAVMFDGDGQQLIRGTRQSGFNTVFFTGSNVKILQRSITVNQDFNILAGVNRVEINPSVTVTGTAGGSLTQTGGRFQIEGTNNFPAGFGNINLTGGEVIYFSNSNQNIFATTYFDLGVARFNVGNTPTKTLLGDITVNDDLIIYHGEVTLAANDFTINLEDVLSLATGGQQVDWGTPGGTGTLNHFGDWWGIDPDITGFNNLILSGTGSKRMSSPLTITGDVIIGDGITLGMEGHTMIGTGTKLFTMIGTSRVVTDNILASLPAFPTAFGTYNLAVTSRVTLNGAGNQIVYTRPTYGRLDIYSDNNVSLDGNLDVNGDFYMNNEAILSDQGHNINFGGRVDIRDYTATFSSTTTFDGIDQVIINDDITTTDFINLNHVVFAGSGVKTLTNGQDHYRIAGNLTVNAGVTVNLRRNFDFSGENFTNNGTFNHTTNVINFNRTGIQTLDFGADHSVRTIRFENAGGTKSIVNNGLNVDAGQLEFFSNATVDFGNLTHNLAITGVNDDNTETLITSNANVIYDRLGTQIILKNRTWNNITFAGTGNKLVGGVLTANDILINNGVRLFASSDYGTDIGGFVVRGNWTNTGEFFDYTSTVAFESTDVMAKTIDNNGFEFYNVTFNQADVNARVYTLLSNLTIQEDLIIGNGATLDVNNFDLTLGNNDAGSPDGEQHLIAAGATLTISPGSNLLFDATDSGAGGTSDPNPTLIVDGTLNLVGISGNLARIDRVAGSFRIDIDIQTGGTINARFYEISTLVDEGLDVQAGAIIGASGASNNFSDGTWSGISTANSGNRLYLNIEADATGMADINNVTFNHGASPTQTIHFNVRRSGAATGTITFAGIINGLLAGELYEDDGAGGTVTPGQIVWPPLSFTTWTGGVSSDWSVVGNWTAGVPTSILDAVIGLEINNPIIDVTSGDGVANSVTITNGILTLNSGNDLNVNGDLIIGQGTASGILAVGNSASGTFISGGLTIGINGIYIPGDGTFTFNAAGGTVSITPNNASFHNVSFTGAASYLVIGATLDINGNVNITNGTLSFSTNNYTAHIAGDMLNTGGNFNTSTAGTVVLDGAEQTINNVSFNGLTADGTLTKTLQGTVNVADELLINATLNAGTSTLTMDGNVTVASTGTFNDGNGTHSFNGQNWTGTGAYMGNGTIVFTRTGNQFIHASKFNTLDMAGTGNKWLEGNTDLTGNLLLRTSITSMRLGTSLFNNISGTGTFTTEANVNVYVLGTNNYPEGFAIYAPDPTSLARYEGTNNQTIRGVQYGRLWLLNPNTKTLGGNIDVDGDLDFNTAILDVSASNFEIRLAAEWDNNNGGSFIARNGQVVLDGAATGFQNIRAGITGIKDFHDLVINKASGRASYLANGVDVTILNDLIVQNGSFRNEYDNRNFNIGNSINCIGGTIESDGRYVMTKATGTGFITANGSTFRDLDINTGGTILLQDNLIVGNLFNVIAGTFNANGHTVALGDWMDVATISGTYIMGAGGRLELGRLLSFTVTPTGTMVAVGTGGMPAVITRRLSHDYNFNVQGTISARHYLFEFMSTSGIRIENGATIDEIDNFSDGTFANGAPGGTLFNIENTQELIENPGRINNVVFSTNPGGGASNVSKLIAGAGIVEFYDAVGAFRGANFESDPSDLIIWTGTETLTWTAGAGTTDWFTAGNWESSLGGNKVPTPTDIVIIDDTPVLQPIINVDGTAVVRAEARSVTINLGAILTLSTLVDDAFADIDVSGDMTINGIFITNSAQDRIRIQGAWTRGGSGSFSQSTSRVDFAASGGVDVINNGTSPFYDITIQSGSFQLGNNTVVANNFSINMGASFDVGANRRLTIGSDFSNAGSFDAQSGLVLFNTSTAGTRIIESGGSSFYNVTIQGTATATYSLQSTTTVLNDFNVIGGDFTLNANTLNMGDPAGSDILTVGGTSTFIIGANGRLRMGANTFIQVNSGATLQVVGTNAANRAIINSQSGSYSFVVVSGGQLNAQFYEINNLNATGLTIQNGGVLHATNNLSDGSFAGGAPGGRYLLLEHNLAADITISNVVFNSGPAVNIRRLAGANNIIFSDASGVLAGAAFEHDSPANGATDGRIRWDFVSLITWAGTTSSNWNEGSNWIGGIVPTTANDVLIPSGTPNSPVLNTGAGAAKDLTVQAGAIATLDGGINLDLSGAFINSGTFTHTSGELTVNGNWTNVGTYAAATGASVYLAAATGNILVETGGSAFCNLLIDSDKGAGNGNAVFQTNDPIIVNCSMDVIDGTLQIMNSTHDITINNTVGTTSLTIRATASFVHGGSTVNLQTTGTGVQLEAIGSSLNNVVTSGTGSVSLLNNLTIENNLTLGANTNAGSSIIMLEGNIVNTGTFTPVTSTVNLVGTTTQTITATGGISFNHLTVNNSSILFPQIVLNNAVTVTGILALTDGIVSSSVTNFVHVNGGIITGGSTASYVDGPLQMTAATDLTFPVGDGLVYARIGAESLTDSNGFTAQYFDITAPNQGNVSQTGGPLSHVSGVEYWNLSRTSGASAPLVRLYWEDGTRSDITDLTGGDLVVAHYTAGNWQSEGQGVITGSIATGSVRSASALSSLSPVTFGTATGANPLPVELLSFEAEELSQTVKLTWETASELNNDFFTLYRSKDGENFEEITTIAGAGDSNKKLAYSFIDERPFNGISYYRLAQTDFDGTYVEAGTVLVKMASNSQALELISYPNPFQNEAININVAGLNDKESVTILIVDAFGRQQFLQKYSANSSGYLEATVNQSLEWNSGVYIVRVLTEKGAIQTRVIKQ